MNRQPRNRRPRGVAGRKPAPAGGSRPSGIPPEETFAESDYLKRLVQDRTPIVVRLRDNEEFAGILEYYDANFIRLTRKQGPNLFIYKHEIKYLSERPDSTS